MRRLWDRNAERFRLRPGAPLQLGQRSRLQLTRFRIPRVGGHGKGPAGAPTDAEASRGGRGIADARPDHQPSPHDPDRFPPKPRKRLTRLLAFALLAVGLLALVEGALTVLWREPITAILTANVQDDLSAELDSLRAEGQDGATFASVAANDLTRAQTIRRTISRKAIQLDRKTEEGEPLGELEIDALDLDFVVVQGTSEEPLKKGPGHYTETPLPGARGDWTVGIAGHRTTWDAPFRELDKLEEGDSVAFKLPYARFRYEVEEIEIVDADELGVFRPQGHDRLSLSACHPLYSDAQRIIVHSKLVDRKPLGNVVPAEGREELPEPGLAISAVAVDAPPPVAEVRPRLVRGARSIEATTADLSSGPPVGPPADEPVAASTWTPETEQVDVALAEPHNPLAPPWGFVYLAGFSAALTSVGTSLYGLRRGNRIGRDGLLTSLACSALVLTGLVLALLGYI